MNYIEFVNAKLFFASNYVNKFAFVIQIFLKKVLRVPVIDRFIL